MTAAVRGRALWASVALLAADAFVYAPVRGHGFVNLDDRQYVADNPMVAAGLSRRGLAWAFSTGHAGNWHPLTWLSHMLDVELHGMDPGGHHVTSALLHAASTLVLFGLLRGMTGAVGRSAFAAALFGVHPLHVESVAWVAERKDVLSGLLGLLALLAYVGYARRPGPLRYGVVLGLFALGLMAKPMLVTLPLVMLLLDWWPLGRIASRAPAALVKEKLPLLALSLASSVVTLVVQSRGGAVKGLDVLPLGARVSNALVAYVAYIGKTLWPAELAAIYPYPASIPDRRVAVAAALLVVATVLALRFARRRPYLAVGWLWYLGMLVPVIGLVQVGGQPMADRYTYLPLIGLFLIVAWGVPDLLDRFDRRGLALRLAAAGVVVACALAARAQVGHWRDSIALWEHALDVTERNHRAHNNLGHALARQGRLDDAIPHYREALRIKPDYAEAHANLALALDQQGASEEAVAHYEDTLRLLPDDVEAHVNLGVALARQGRLDEAIRHFSEALRIRPGLAMAHANLGSALAARGKSEEAEQSFREALRIEADNPEAHKNLGFVLAAQGRLDEAVPHYREALRTAPDDALAHNGLGAALAQIGRLDEAATHYREALRLDPRLAEAHSNLGTILAGQGRTEDALLEFLEAARLRPNEPDFHYDAAVLLVRLGRAAEAIDRLREALRLDPGHAPARRALETLRR